MIKREIRCAICQQSFRQLGNHVRRHNLTAREYKRKYRYLSFKDMLVEKINLLFVTSRQEWIHFWVNKKNPEIRGIRTNNAKLKVNRYFDRPLNDRDLKQHLAGKPTIGLKEKKVAKYLCFDVDLKNDLGTEEKNLNVARAITRELMQELARYIDIQDAHLEFSGKKGYHLWIFFSKAIAIKGMVAFGKYVSAFNRGNVDVAIELRPESDEGKGVKLPLGYHFKTGKFCTFVDKDTFEAVPDPYEYLLAIKQIEPFDFGFFVQALKQEQVIKTLAEEKPQLAKISSISRDYDHLWRVWQEGLPELGVRHEYTFLLAILLKEQGIDRETAKKMLFEFTDREWLAGRTKDSGKKSAADINSTVDNVFDRGYTFRDIRLNEFELSLVGCFPASVRKTLEIVLRIGKTAPDNKGFIFISTDRLVRESGYSKATVKRHLAKLQDKILFRMYTGIPRHKLAKERNMLARELPSEAVEVLDEKFLNPEEGLNSLYYIPVLGKQFTLILREPEHFLWVVRYSWYAYRMAHMKALDFYYKHKIILKENITEMKEVLFEAYSQYCIKAWYQESISLFDYVLGNLERFLREQTNNPGLIADIFYSIDKPGFYTEHKILEKDC